MENQESEELMKFFIASSKFMVHVTGIELDKTEAFSQSIKMLNGLSPSKRLAGLKMSANDTIDMTWDMNAEQAKLFDQMLINEGCKPLSFFRSKNKKAIVRLSGNMPLRNEVDYYALKNHFESEWQTMEQKKADQIRKKLAEFEKQKLK
jgi:hypothetical protein